jgi:hypothetical protein
MFWGELDLGDYMMTYISFLTNLYHYTLYYLVYVLLMYYLIVDGALCMSVFENY